MLGLLASGNGAAGLAAWKGWPLAMVQVWHVCGDAVMGTTARLLMLEGSSCKTVQCALADQIPGLASVRA